MNRYWLARANERLGVAIQNPVMTRAEISAGTRSAWDQFYSLRLLWERSRRIRTLRKRLMFVLFFKMYRQMYAGTGFASDSARQRVAMWAGLLALPCRRFFKSPPTPDVLRRTRAA